MIENIHSMVYADESCVAINCIVKFADFNEELPYTAHPNDVEVRGRLVHEAIISGKYGEIKPFVKPEVKLNPNQTEAPNVIA